MAPLIRPEVARILRPFLLPSGFALAGLWLGMRGGYVYTPLGVALAALGLALAVVEFRRLRIGPGAELAPGVVELSEGTVRFWAARGLGGEMALGDLVEIRLLRLHGRAHWRLRSARGEALLIAADAQCAGLLADAFAALPGADLGALAHARHIAARADGPAVQTVWRRETAPGPASQP